MNGKMPALAVIPALKGIGFPTPCASGLPSEGRKHGRSDSFSTERPPLVLERAARASRRGASLLWPTILGRCPRGKGRQVFSANARSPGFTNWLTYRRIAVQQHGESVRAFARDIPEDADCAGLCACRSTSGRGRSVDRLAQSVHEPTTFFEAVHRPSTPMWHIQGSRAILCRRPTAMRRSVGLGQRVCRVGRRQSFWNEKYPGRNRRPFLTHQAPTQPPTSRKHQKTKHQHPEARRTADLKLAS